MNITEDEYKEFSKYKKLQSHEEYQYLETVRDIIDNGLRSEDRTGVGTVSTFGTMMRFSLRDGKIPQYTSRKTFVRGAVEELLWMLRGDTNANNLASKNVNIWNGNTTREFLDQRGLEDFQQGDIGTLYGFQMRHWGAEYHGFNHDYTGEGIDQIAKVIELIKTTPKSRRILVSNYNVSQLDTGCLEPCHTLFQFYVDTEKKELSSLLYMRSVDMMCGQPLNVLFYSIMTHLFAKLTGYTAGDFVFTSGDTHVYLNHLDNAKAQIEREPKPFPTLTINKDLNTLEDILSMGFDDFEINGYEYHPPLKYEMAI
jgi:thymidylate synthase